MALSNRQLKNIVRESVQMSLDAIKQNKLRSILTLLGISVGIFSVISVMTAIKTLENSIESGLNVFGTNTFMVTKSPAIQFGRNEKYRNRKNIDLDQYDRLICMDKNEHKPMIQSDPHLCTFKFEYWDITDMPKVDSDISLPKCYKQVESLWNQVSSN